MKKKHWMTLGLIAAVLVFYIAIAVFAGSGRRSENRQIDQMAQYLNEKYAYSVTEEDCIYFREADYSFHEGWIMGTQYDVPNIAIFKFDGKTIVTTERDGFYGDDGQLAELNDLLCGYFEEQTGLDIAYVEVRRAGNGNIVDWTLNEILHHDYNALLTSDTIDDFVGKLWSKDANYHLIFYFYALEDRSAQVEEVSLGLGKLRAKGNLASMVFYITDMDALNVHYMEPWALGQTDKENETEIEEKYVWGHYHVVNDVEHHYPANENNYFSDAAFNSFVVGGYWELDNRYAGGFDSWKTATVNDFAVADLSDAALEGHLQEMVSYGEFRGYTILFRAGNQEAESSLTISEGDKYRWTFSWNTGPVELYAFKNGKLIDLKTAYDCAYLGPEEMDAILERHKAYRSQNK